MTDPGASDPRRPESDRYQGGWCESGWCESGWCEGGWYEGGYGVLEGPSLTLLRRVDAVFAGWAEERGAVALDVPPLIPARVARRARYLTSFPHLVGFPVSPSGRAEVLDAFVEAERARGPGDPVALDVETEAVRDVLLPAGCHHVFARLEGSRGSGGEWTLCATCFRRESSAVPLERQRVFRMRELVAVGSPEQIRAFTEELSAKLEAVSEQLGLGLERAHATDPFFRPETQPAHLMQRVDHVKAEYVRPDGLALASVNQHRTGLTEAFDIRLGETAASSACVAMGLERWVGALLKVHGPDPAQWPEALR